MLSSVSCNHKGFHPEPTRVDKLRLVYVHRMYIIYIQSLYNTFTALEDLASNRARVALRILRKNMRDSISPRYIFKPHAKHFSFRFCRPFF